MSDDVLITPASRKIEFKDSGGNVDGTIQLDSSGNLVLTSSVGLLIGDLDADIHIGDGINTVDMVFDFAGSIYSAANQTLTIGKKSLGGNDIIIDTPNYLNVQTDSGYVRVGPANTSWSHFTTDRGKYYFNKPIVIDGGNTNGDAYLISAYNTEDFVIATNNGTEDRITIKQATGNVGIGTTSPAHNLDVASNSNPTIFIRNTDATHVADDKIGSLLFFNAEDSSGETGSRVGAGLRFVATDAYGRGRLELTAGTSNPISTYGDTEDYTDDSIARLSILTDGGKVGIGTTSPNQPLTVEGTMSLKEQASANADTAAYGQLWVKTATPNELYFTTDAGNDIQLTSGTSIAGGGGGAVSAVANGANNRVATFSSADALNGEANMTFDGNDLIVDTGSTTKIRTQGSNNYAATLVAIAQGAHLAMGDMDNAEDEWLKFGAFSGINNLDTKTRDFHLYGTNTTTGFYFDESAGSFGIGTSTPGHKLHVLSEATEIIAEDGSSGIKTGIKSGDAAGNVGTFTNSDFNILTNGSTRMRIDNGGDVGIGTTSPGYKLDVNGSIRAVDDMYTDKLIASEGIRSSSRASFNTMQMYFYDRQSMGTQAVLLRVPVGGSSSANPSNYFMPHAGVVMQVLMGFYAQTLATSGTDTWSIIKTDTNGIASSVDFDVNFANLNRIGTTNSYNILIDISVLADASNLDFVAGDMLQIQRTDSSPISIGNCNAQLWVTFDI